ncbi:MAG: cupin domain-containing protein [Phycisphaeraceae bacterium]
MDRFALCDADSAQVMTFDWGRLYWYASGPQGNSSALTVGKCVLDPGQANPKHYHPNCEEVLHVLSGRIEHFIDGAGWMTMGSGDTLAVAPNVWHHARNTGDVEAHLLICFSSADRQTVGE